MTPKRTKQSSITSMGFSLLQKPREMCVDRQIKVLGSYWKGHMSNEDVNSLYLYTVHNYHALHKWDSGGIPSQVMEIQEMGVDGQGSRETGGSASDLIFFMKYPMSSLQVTTLVRNLSPSTAGQNDHRYFRCFPPICWCGRRHGRGKQLGRHSIHFPAPAPQQGCCLQVLDSCIR
jgi:hypothetical protein